MKNILSEYHFDSNKQVLRKMRTTTLLLILSISSLYANNVKSQITKVSFTVQNASISDVIEKIESQTDYLFVYNKNEIDFDRKVNVSATNQPVAEILSDIFKNTNIVYAKEGTNIMLMQKSAPSQQNITGIVTDISNSPLPGVNVIVTGSTYGTITDANGKYSIDIPAGSKSLTFTFIGMETQEISIGTSTQINVIMVSSAIGLDEVVVIGYGTQKRINLTGAISNVDSKVLESRPIANLGQGLQGIISNLNITQGDGSLGKSASFNIRGNTSINGGSPLILVNGIPMDVNLINPNDIENISVLKDAASAAIYGARGAFGVILITTKGGMKKEKPTISLSMNYSLNTPIVRFKTMDAMEVMNYMDAASMRQNGQPYWDQYYHAAITAHYNDPSQPEAFIHPDDPNRWSGCANTDWPREVLRDYYPMQQYTASVSGGSDKFDYYTSFSYFNEEGIAKHFDEKYNRYNFMTNLNYDITKWITVGTKISINTSNKKYPTNDSNDFFNEDFVPLTTRNRPFFPVYDPNGHYAAMAGNIVNVVQQEEEGGYRTRDIGDSWLTGIVKLIPVKNLTFNMDYSFNLKNTNELDYRRLIPLYDVSGNVYGYYTKTSSSSVARSNYDDRYYVFNAYANYENTFNEKHYIKIMAGFNQENSANKWFQAKRNDLLIGTIPYMNIAYGDRYTYDSGSEYAIRGAFTRLNYSFANRYLFEFNGRYDGSSKFPKKDRFAFFPSASFGWRVDNEAFFTSLKNSINMLKFRVSYGSLGNQNVTGNYPYISTFSSGEVDYLINGVKPTTVYAPGLVSATLTWETVTQQDYGVDFAVLDSRLTGSFDIYRRDTRNMLTKSQTLPAVLAVDEPNSNAADMKTTGFELTLDWKHSLHDVTYGITFLLSDYTSEITKYSNPNGIISDYYAGYKLGEIWGLTTGGLFQTDEEAAALDQTEISGRQRKAGDIWFVDTNGDGKITRGSQTLSDHGDMKIIGNNTPHYSFGFKPNVSWKGFDLEIFLQGVAKRDMVLGNDYFLMQYVSEYPAYPKIGTDYWTPENRDAYFPAPVFDNDEDVLTTQTRFLQNAAYIRLKQLTFGYTIPVNLTRKVGIEKIRVYFSGNNICEATKMVKVSDPEQFIKVSDGQQFSGKAYPLNRSISFGANISF